MQRGAQLDAPTYNLTFAQFDNRRDDPDLRLGPGPGTHQFGKHPVVLRPTIGIARTVFGDRADEHTARADHFRPTHCHGKKVCVAKGHVGYRDGP